MIGIPQGTDVLFGITWKKYFSGHDLSEYNDSSKKIGEVNSGLTVTVYENSQYGLIAFSVDALNQIRIEDINKALDMIKQKTDMNRPYIIYCDVNHKSLYSQWNNGNNTIILLKDFYNEIGGKL